MTWALESLKNVHFNSLLLNKVYIVWANKSTWGIWWILTRALESLKNFHFNEILFSTVYIVWAKKYRGVIFHKTEEGCKIWRRIRLLFQNWHKEFDTFWPEHSKVSKMFTLIVSFWAKYILFELIKVQRSYLSTNWRGIQNLERNQLVASRPT